jgi:hypothetical protein
LICSRYTFHWFEVLAFFPICQQLLLMAQTPFFNDGGCFVGNAPLADLARLDVD